MKPAALLLLVGLVYGVEEEQGKGAMVNPNFSKTRKKPYTE